VVAIYLRRRRRPHRYRRRLMRHASGQEPSYQILPCCSPSPEQLSGRSRQGRSDLSPPSSHFSESWCSAKGRFEPSQSPLARRSMSQPAANIVNVGALYPPEVTAENSGRAHITKVICPGSRDAKALPSDRRPRRRGRSPHYRPGLRFLRRVGPQHRPRTYGTSASSALTSGERCVCRFYQW
jgi:hypothetical protein